MKYKSNYEITLTAKVGLLWGGGRRSRRPVCEGAATPIERSSCAAKRLSCAVGATPRKGSHGSRTRDQRSVSAWI